MTLEREAGEWIIRVPDKIVALLDLNSGDQVTLRPAVKRGEEFDMPLQKCADDYLIMISTMRGVEAPSKFSLFVSE